MKRFYILFFGALVCVLVIGGSKPVEARIKLVALPERGATTIRLDNPQATLIEEERVLMLQKGLNKVDFSWNGVYVDPDSIRLTILGNPDAVKLLNVSYPPNENALVWEISSNAATEELVRVSYLLSNIDRLVSYRAKADKKETQVDLKSHLILRNFSGEDFAQARVLLGYGEAFERGVRHEETKQLLFMKKIGVPIEKVWTWDAGLQAWDPEKVQGNVGIPVRYRITNNTASQLGESALWGGKARIYQDDGHGSTILLGEDRTGLTPLGADMEIYIGDSRDVVVTQRKMLDKRVNVKRNSSNGIVLYDNEEQIKATIENFKDTPAILTMVQRIPGEWDMKKSSNDYTLTDAHTLEFEIALPPNSKKEFSMHYIRRNMR